MSASAYYDEFSKTYDRGRDRGYHALIDELETDIVLPLARDADVLELGCGTGLILEQVAKVAKSAHGIDVSEGMLQHARERGLDVTLGSVTDLPFEDASFDLAYSFKVLAHVESIGTALAEAARVVRPGGHLVLEFYNPWSLRYLVKRVGGPQRIGGRSGGPNTEADMFTRWDSPSVLPRLMPAGVEIVETQGVRVFTPAAKAHDIPVLGSMLRLAERSAVRSPLHRFAGFLVVIARRVR